MEPYLIWLLCGLLLLVAELLLPGVFLLWVGLAAIGTGLVLFVVAPPFSISVAVFLVLLAAGIAVGLKRRRDRGPAAVNTPDGGLVGRHGTVLEPVGASLRVRLGDSDWPARLAHDVAEALPGARVRVEGVDGVTLVIRPSDTR